MQSVIRSVVFMFVSLSASALEISDQSLRIVNGFELDIEEIPYQAILRRRVSLGWSHSCGAIVASSNAVLTAAHCVQEHQSSPSNIRVVVGTSFRLIGGTNYDVKRFIIHSEYSSTTLLNDIALVLTAGTIAFTQYVRPVTIPAPEFDIPVGTQALVSGYGYTAYDGEASAVLRAAYVSIVDQEVCWRSYFGIATVTPEMICASATKPSRDACQGDSGGPLAVNGSLIGIVSWGEGCADRDYPGVYTRVTKYSLWVQEQIETFGD